MPDIPSNYHFYYFKFVYIKLFAQLAGAAEYTDCLSAEG